MILQGVARQILSKSGVRLWWVSLPKELPLPAVFVGVDIFHAPRQYDRAEKRRVRKPSCAGIVVQVLRSDSEQTRRVEVYSETYILPGGQEAGLRGPLRRTVHNALKALNVSPMSCIVWRDGIAESSFDSIARDEIDGIRAGLGNAGDLTAELVSSERSPYERPRLEPAPHASLPREGRDASDTRAALKQEDPEGITSVLDNILSNQTVSVTKEVRDVPMAYIVCQKRIATKLLTTGTIKQTGENLEGLYGAPSGTLVDGIQGLNMYDTFYIQGRAPPFSTPKPVRYITIKQDKELQNVNIPKLTWDMCHDYPNWVSA